MGTRDGVVSANDPELRQVVGHVWRWDDLENPLRTGRDTGIDIVAERLDKPGAYWAMQCKNYDERHKLTYRELGTFFCSCRGGRALFGADRGYRG